jgi:hypothetical protein
MSIERLAEKALALLINRKGERRQPTIYAPEGLGRDVGSPFAPFGISHTDRLKHTYVLGATACGNTNLLVQLIDEDIKRGGSVVILDLRGDLVDRVLRSCAEIVPSQNLHLIDLRRPEISAGINPFCCGSDPYSSALQMHTILRSAAESWGVQLDETLRSSLIALSFSRRSIADIPQFLTESSFRANVVSAVADSQVKALFERLPSDARLVHLDCSRRDQQNSMQPDFLTLEMLRIRLGYKTAKSVRHRDGKEGIELQKCGERTGLYRRRYERWLTWKQAL